MERLRDTPCENNECAYCRGAFNGKEGLKYFFKYDSFRTYEGEDLQQKAVEAAIEGESLLACFSDRRRKIHHIPAPGFDER